ncbi:MAG: ROK family protein [Pseudomonadota bacterium]|nr:ROK family protein [Pseudomonadota bacterium]
MNRDRRYFGAVEAGGTKFMCAIADEQGMLHAQARFPTADPGSTLAAVSSFLVERSRAIGPLSGIGVGSFGPINLDKQSAKYGFIGNTPKKGWNDIDIVGVLRRHFPCPVGFDTDVNAAALGEHRWGAGKDASSLLYLTVGTGIGGGVLVNGLPLHGLMHPELGHIYPRRHSTDTDFNGVCPFHGDCMEGLASGPAIVARCGNELKDLEAGHPQWDLEADYLGQLCALSVLSLSPQRIVMGGGVMIETRLFPVIRQRLLHWLGGYIDRNEILDAGEDYVVPAALGEDAGVLGCIALAVDAAAAVASRR